MFYFILQVIFCHWGTVKTGAQNKSLKQKPQRDAACWLAVIVILTYLSYVVQAHWPEWMVLPTVGWVLLHPLAIKQMSTRSVWWRQSFSWGSLSKCVQLTGMISHHRLDRFHSCSAFCCFMLRFAVSGSWKEALVVWIRTVPIQSYILVIRAWLYMRRIGRYGLVELDVALLKEVYHGGGGGLWGLKSLSPAQCLSLLLTVDPDVGLTITMFAYVLPWFPSE